MARYFRFPFAENGDRQPVPDDSLTEEVNYESGYTPAYELEKDNPDRRNIDRQPFNSILFDVTENLKSWQENGTPEIVADDGNGNPVSYAKGFVGRSGGVEYVALVDGTGTVPPSPEWREVDFSNFNYRRLIQLTGEDSIINSDFEAVYTYSSASTSHVTTIASEASNEGATVTRLVCLDSSDFDLSIELSGVTAVWSFDESESIDGYGIQPGEAIELVKVGTNSYVAYAPNGISQTIQAGGGYDAGSEYTATRNGNSVTITANSIWSHSSAQGVLSSQMPSIFWPVKGGGEGSVLGPSLMYGAIGAAPQAFARVRVSEDGVINTRYNDGNFNGVSRGNIGEVFTISYAVRNS